MSRHRAHLAYLTLGFAFASAVACGDDPKPPTEEVPSAGKGGSGGKGGSSSGGKAGKGGTGGSGDSAAGGQVGDAGDTSSGGIGGSTGGKGGSGGGGSSGKGGSSGTGGTAGTVSDGGEGNQPPVADCNSPWSEPSGDTSCDLDALVDSGVTLPSMIDADLTLETGKTYNLSGPTRVMPGVALTIQPCVKVFGQSPQSVLAVLAGDDGDNDPATNGVPGPGGQLVAIGEPDAPIVFTSNVAVGNRRPGDWGGIIILGNAGTNDATADARPVIEGLEAATPYGWHTDEFEDESSGSLQYVRVEFAGRDLGGGNESNGITFGAVGSGTSVHHVMVANSLDDCFEWFGGSVSPHHLIASYCDDDMFDADRGFQGNPQFLFGRQYPQSLETDSSGFEIDSAHAMGGRVTTAVWSNVTLCGTEDELGPSFPRVAMALRRDVAGKIQNGIFTGFDSGAISVDSVNVTARLAASVLYDNVFLQSLAAANVGGPAWWDAQEAANESEGTLANSTEEPEGGLCNCWSDPPVPFPLERIPGEATTGLFDEDSAYIGAFESATPAANWMRGKWSDGWADR